MNAALIGGAAFLAPTSMQGLSWVLGAVGIAICALWVRNVTSYKTLNAAKFDVIQKLEKRLPIQPYSDEWALLDPDGSGQRHRPFHKTEVIVPYAYMVVHALQAARSVPWNVLVHALCLGS